MVKVVLGLAERRVVLQVLGGVPRVKVSETRMVRGLREQLELRAVEEEIASMVKAAKARGEEVEWDDLLEFEPEMFEVDEVLLKWLKAQLKRKDFAQVRTQQGKSVEVPVAISQMVAIANLADAVDEALG